MEKFLLRSFKFMFKTTLLQTSVSLRLNMAKITDNTAVSLFISVQ